MAVRSVIPTTAANAASPTLAMYSGRSIGLGFNTNCVRNTSRVDTIRYLGVEKATGQTALMEKKTASAILCGTRIARAMEASGLSQADTAGLAGMPSSRLGNYIQGSRKLPLREARALATVLKSHAAYLMGVVDELDRDVLLAPQDKKQSFLALLNTSAPRPPEPKAPAMQEAPRPITRSGKRSGAQDGLRVAAAPRARRVAETGRKHGR